VERLAEAYETAWAEELKRFTKEGKDFDEKTS